jgi:hypothetical protein
MKYYNIGDLVITYRRRTFERDGVKVYDNMEGVIIAIHAEEYLVRFENGDVTKVPKSGYYSKANGDLKKSLSFRFAKKVKV